MSNFSREATKLLRAAEDALSGRRPAAPSPQELWGRGEDCEGGVHGHPPVLELQRQLRVAMTEIGNLRSELLAERESRSQTIALLGRRWKEEMLVELRAAEHQSHRAIAELEVNMQQQHKEEVTARAVMQRQLDEALRCAKVRGRSQFEQQECIQEQLDSLRERLEMAVAECGLLRVESAQQLEKERASLAQRLDVELLRYVDMRRDDQREREALKQQLRAEFAATGGQVKELVDAAWRTHATALERTLREPLETFAQKIARHEELVAGVDVKVHDCTTACHAEVRLQTVSLKERLGALESSSAVTASRMDRAERKADAAQEAVSRVDANVGVARDMAERAQAQAQRAMERAQRMEDTVQDRDARLTQVESHLGAAATAEKLRAEIEGVRRAALRAESGVDALRQVCERDEQLAEHTRRVVEGYTDRIEGCEQLVHRLRGAVEMVEGRVPQLQQRVAVLEETREGLVASATRIDDVVAQVGHRVQTLEATVKGVGERLEQSRRDTLAGLQSVTVRLEHANDMALHSETSSATARAEVDRMDRRVCELESQAGRFTADATAFRAAAEDHAKDVATLLSRLQQTREWQERRDTRVDDAMVAAEEQLTTATEQMVSQLETKVQRDMRHLQSTLQERTSALEVLLDSKVAPLEEEVVKLRASRGGEDATQALSREVQACRSKVESLEAALAAMRDTAEQEHKEYVLLRDWNALRKTLASLESQLHDTRDDATLQQQACEGGQEKLRLLEREQRRQRQALQELQVSLSDCREETKAAHRSLAAALSLHAVKGDAPTTAASGEEGVCPRGDVQTPLVEFGGVRSSDQRGKMALTSGSGTTATTPRTHPKTSSTEVVDPDNHNDSPEVQLPPPSLERQDDDSRRLSTSDATAATTTTATTATTQSCRLKTSVGDTTNRQQVMAWAEAASGNSAAATDPLGLSRVVAPEPALFASVVAPPITTRVVGTVHTAGGSDQRADAGGLLKGAEVKVASMQPPRESSSSVGSQEEQARHVRRGPLWLRASRDESVGEAGSSAVVPFTTSGETRESAPSVTSAKDTTETADEEAFPAKPKAAWYDDWDDGTESEKVLSVKGERQGGTAAEVVPITRSLQPSRGEKTYTTLRKSFVTSSSASSFSDSKKKRVTAVPPASAPKNFTSFDDTTSEEEEKEEEV
ncbi:hypothetical protein TraAM80_02507 [Trypanosoma rangeli]|uniref:Uncharacterized protein n=1 Tax=Trypanosoma rangeli TaxID=5698 RepID=A0A3R7M4X7_TRYRA|nr:uncharacterized protein TraAM80_02507 [Trypanosoma rangeli]RNF09075.1 hypothetical protein TraAM80_02507 [Trypanosoma rangeli]|eukprot:RNF09075.1 hypothetical protein TraAM80_02507 [Trypanosoma rangeli]